MKSLICSAVLFSLTAVVAVGDDRVVGDADENARHLPTGTSGIVMLGDELVIVRDNGRANTYYKLKLSDAVSPHTGMYDITNVSLSPFWLNQSVQRTKKRIKENAQQIREVMESLQTDVNALEEYSHRTDGRATRKLRSEIEKIDEASKDLEQWNEKRLISGLEDVAVLDGQLVAVDEASTKSVFLHGRDQILAKYSLPAGFTWKSNNGMEGLDVIKCDTNDDNDRIHLVALLWEAGAESKGNGTHNSHSPRLYLHQLTPGSKPQKFTLDKKEKVIKLDTKLLAAVASKNEHLQKQQDKKAKAEGEKDSEKKTEQVKPKFGGTSFRATAVVFADFQFESSESESGALVLVQGTKKSEPKWLAFVSFHKGVVGIVRIRDLIPDPKKRDDWERSNWEGMCWVGPNQLMFVCDNASGGKPDSGEKTRLFRASVAEITAFDCDTSQLKMIRVGRPSKIKPPVNLLLIPNE